MTPLYHALQKAFTRGSHVSDAVKPALPEALTKRGWVPKLRAPINHVAKRTTTDGQAAALKGVARAWQADTSAEAEDYALMDPEPGRDEAEKVYRVDPGLRMPIAVPEISPREASVWRGAPPICDQLLDGATGPGIRELVRHLEQILEERPLKSLVLTGSERSAGRTALLLTVARLLVEQTSLRVLLVDLDCSHPELAALLSVDPQQGLWQAICGLVATPAVLVPLVPQRLTLLPLRDRLLNDDVTPLHAAAIFGLLQQLRDDFDVVLIDAGPWSEVPAALRQVSIADASLWVARCATAGDAGSSIAGTPQGIEILGVVETFAPIVREFNDV